MIDLSLLREEAERVITLLKRKEPQFNIELLIELDKAVRALRAKVETLRHEKNSLASQAKAGVTQSLREQSVRVGKELKNVEKELQEQECAFEELYLACPNIPFEELPQGGKESNKVVKVEGKKPEFAFNLANHLELGTKLGWFDFSTAATMAASNFVFYKNEGVKLIYALTMFMLKHNQEYGYQMTLPPYLVNEKSLLIASNFPKFKDQVYAMPDDSLFLIPTAEVSLANMYRDHIFMAEELPIRLTAWTSCFRREAGSYGAHERGLIRIHQFEKVELYAYCVPEKSDQELDRMLDCAQGILKKLGLHYRVSLLAAQDCSFPSAKTYDIEVYFPSSNEFKEVSSCSNCTDFQARRGGMRYRHDASSKTKFVHTLNGSSLALPRLMVALMETYQQADGSIAIPDILKPYML